MSITDFLLARIAEDEEAARAAALALREAADALELHPPMLRAQYVATLRLYADELLAARVLTTNTD